MCSTHNKSPNRSVSHTQSVSDDEPDADMRRLSERSAPGTRCALRRIAGRANQSPSLPPSQLLPLDLKPMPKEASNGSSHRPVGGAVALDV
mmetsp:Transcript_59688/g.132917  ORF Transcript_59688/g.132917 Transcript_59688/m.132917 type:complete len:91 (+) Transcript_59688:656-928(+)